MASHETTPQPMNPHSLIIRIMLHGRFEHNIIA